jgi:curved DNA-binding protein CbpA
MNYYVILGVPTTADAAAIRTAFRGLVRRYHPDAGAGSSAQRFREIVEAYETLSDPVRRRRYDASLRPSSRFVRVERLIPDDPEPLLFRRAPRPSRDLDVGFRAHHEDLLELLRALDHLFWDF